MSAKQPQEVAVVVTEVLALSSWESYSTVVIASPCLYREGDGQIRLYHSPEKKGTIQEGSILRLKPVERQEPNSYLWTVIEDD